MHQNKFTQIRIRAAALCLTAAVAAIWPAFSQEANKPGQARLTAPASQRRDVAQFRARLQTILSQPAVGRLDWGIAVADRDSGEILYERNADHSFTPASNAKIVTTLLALASLGPDYRFHTTLESQRPLASDGRLAGDLILVGRGDPDLSNRRFPYVDRDDRIGPVEKILAELADAAVAKGLRSVDGDVVADDSYYPYDPYPAGWSNGDLFFSFGAPISAVTFNDNTVSVIIEPADRIGDPAIVQTEPPSAFGTFASDITTGPSDTVSDFAVVRQPGVNFILLRGVIGVGRPSAHIDIAMTLPAETAALSLKQLLESRGVRVAGVARAHHGPPPYSNAAGEPILPTAAASATPDRVPTSSTVLAEHVSQPLLETIRLTNKMSHNLHAELLLRAVGREKFGVGSTAAGLKIEREFLRTVGVPDGAIALSDGSGLGRDDLVTPRAMVTLLEYAARQPWGKDFRSTLPISGEDGTLEGRLLNSPATGRIEAKTGEIEHDRGLSGYATTLRGEPLVFSIFYNNDPEHGVATAAPIDAIATAMVETLGTPPRPEKK